MFFPFSQQPQYNPMDFINFMKAMDEYYKSINPKKDDKKMIPAPEPWAVGDYITFYVLVNAFSSLCLTALVLHFAK